MPDGNCRPACQRTYSLCETKPKPGRLATDCGPVLTEASSTQSRPTKPLGLEDTRPSAPLLAHGFCETKPRSTHVFKQMIRGGRQERGPTHRRVRTIPLGRSQDPPKGWSGRDVLAGNMGLLRLGPGGTKACLRAADPRSRALETDANRLKGWR
jgi:hypothetical protein